MSKFFTVLLSLLVLCLPRFVFATCSHTVPTVPLVDLGVGMYQGFEGGLYPNGENKPPSTHLNEALKVSTSIAPIGGKIVMLSIGYSNSMQEFEEFRLEAHKRQPGIKLSETVVVNGAKGGQAIHLWLSPSSSNWTYAKSQLSNSGGLTADQVQIMWVKLAHDTGVTGYDKTFPNHAINLKSDLKIVLQNIKTHFPNIKLIYFASRTRAFTSSFAVSPNPEPIAYEDGFAYKWLIEEQINGTDSALDYASNPVLLWGPYLWAGDQSRSYDSFVWECKDTCSDAVTSQCNNGREDFTHPSVPFGRPKIGNLLFDFFSSDETATPWFTGEVQNSSEGGEDGSSSSEEDAVGEETGGSTASSSASGGCASNGMGLWTTLILLLGITLVGRKKVSL